ncbi:MAG: hypothetical protein HY075_14810 [Deltaproteobacteria bacterium]|nr:hypothetical protein [Deltaproteobacteria bacterium]
MSLPEAIAWAECPLEDARDVADLSARERELLGALSNAKLAREFVAGRMAAHRAIEKLTGQAQEVLKDGVGRPCPTDARIRVSISHGRGRAVAAAGFVDRLGVDLCEHADAGRIETLAARFLSRVPPPGSVRGHCAAWAEREAGLKALGLGLLDGGAFEAAGSVDAHADVLATLRRWLVDLEDAVVAIAWA